MISKQNQNCKYDIEINDLSKHYLHNGKKVLALKNINLKIKKGEIFGLLGPNGAGKTTMVSILTTLLQPTSGTAKILGYNVVKQPWSVKISIGLMMGSEMIYHRMTGFKNLKYFSKLYGVKNFKERILDLTDKLNLSGWLHQYVDKYSKGMKLKLALVRVLLTKPRVLFLDEPMLGLDPKGVNTIIEILKELNTTIFLTSHQMNVVERICDRIAFLKKGKILKTVNREGFGHVLSQKIKYKLNIFRDKELIINRLRSLDFIEEINHKNNDIVFTIKSDKFLSNLFGNLKGLPIKRLNAIEQSLDDLFIKYSN
jgi:ABC-2 type transport system ATP-binding protein